MTRPGSGRPKIARAASVHTRRPPSSQSIERTQRNNNCIYFPYRNTMTCRPPPRGMFSMRILAFSMSGTADLSLAEAASLLQSRELSPVDYVAAFLEKIATHDSRLNAFLQVFSDSALADARTAEAEINEGRWRGPLHGVPIALKDLFDVAGEPTTAHSKILQGHRAERSAYVVTKLRDAGAIIIGKTALHEFATGGPSFDLPWPPARNPWRPTHHPGGSSRGSARAGAPRVF